ncbi:SNARE-like domain protein [Leptospira wolbachii serovar Codice str. CDC]|uniref:SNARE-like domain protein n=1 Tax=Leptospira wolbachii serovar Codice str. CDC TaxID=1218599 RepID=R9A834_9LEPT|nr:VTT domain-containing protein [Leptospira wolbachii]EOQ98214.1 SNARE-like domain protein [Leptospira wolbachii serovar Codice str. CDC]
MTVLSLFFSTFVSEDLTCIAAGLLTKEGKLSLPLAILSTGLGIFVGDCLLYLCGYLVRRGIVKWNYLQNLQKTWQSTKVLTNWKQHYKKSIFLSRFFPGTRLPLYFSSGFFTLPFFPFFYISFFAVTIWTTAFVYLVYLYGNLVSLYGNTSHSILFSFCIGLSFYLLYKTLRIATDPSERKKFWILIKKLNHLEFWSASLFYLPLVPYLLYLALRYRGLRYITAVNPGILASGIAGESKSEILNLIPKESVASYLFLSKEEKDSQSRIQNWMLEKNLKFPIIAKPDKGERGFLIKKLNSLEECSTLLQTYPIDWLFQEYLEGPYEVGVFYYRDPRKKKGKIFSITDKVFPEVTGDGTSNLKTLITNHPRFQFQKEAHINHNKHQLDKILLAGETVSIGFIGNHIQGCMFQDGNNWKTKELETKFISIGDSVSGIYFGRFDIRFSDPNEFKLGLGFKIIELNGATSESTNLYDPKFSIFESYSILFRQWKILFQIGYENYRKGVSLYPYKKLYHLVQKHKKYRENFSNRD